VFGTIRSVRRAVLGLILVAGCRQVFGIDDPGAGDAGTIAADADVDAMTCTSASLTCIAGSTLQTCTAPGVEPMLEHCGWGCVDGDAQRLPHCGVLQPHGGALAAADLQDMAALADVSATSATINTSTGQILVGPTTLRAAGLGVIAGIDYEVRGKVAVFRMRTAVLGDVSLTGAYAAALAANGGITITGAIDARGSCTDRIGGPGGSNGGSSRSDGAGPGGGGGVAQGADGGGGAGHVATGGMGGATIVLGGAPGGPAYGDAMITALVGGSGGGAAGSATTATGARGGGGGGAVQLVSNTSLIITGTINAGGCGGESGGGAPGGGGGGGAGGSVLLEAPTITIAGAVAANGGGGGGGGPGAFSGGNATADAVAAPGGTSGHGAGGDGGALAHPAGNAGAMNSTYPGGGGGAAGWLRFETVDGNVSALGTTSPMPSIAPANVQ